MGRSSQTPPGTIVLARNRKALFDYHILERIEAGVRLRGSEVKSIREGKISIKEAYASFASDELFLVGAHVAEYKQAHGRNHDPVRRRKLLMHRRELDRLEQAVARKGLTLVPLAVYSKNGKIKVELGVCRGKKVRDRRSALKEREERREMRRAIRGRG